MNGVLVLDSALKGYTGLGDNLADGMNFGMNHAPGVESIARPVDLLTSSPMHYHCATDAPQWFKRPLLKVKC